MKLEVREYNSVDILKLVLAVFVMIIHSGIDKTTISPLLRIAVPIFFIASSYFFFAKNKALAGKAERRGALLRFVKRNLLLYLFWTIVQLPVVMLMRGSFHDLFPNGILNAVKDVLLGNGFIGSWYIMASVIGVPLVCWASKKIPAGWLVVITLPLYALCCLVTNYRNMFDASSVVAVLDAGYREITGLHFYTSLPVALFWIAMGRFLAERKMEAKSGVLWAALLVCAGLLALERFFIVKYDLAAMDDCYFMLAPLCPVIFLLVRRCKKGFRSSVRIREISVIIYVTHGCCERIVGFLLKKLPIDSWMQDVAKIAISFIVILVLGHVLIYLKERRGARIFKYAY